MMPHYFDGSPEEYYEKVKTYPEWFYEHCVEGGFKFTVNGDRLIVSPSHAIDREMAELVKTHKPALIKLITASEV